MCKENVFVHSFFFIFIYKIGTAYITVLIYNFHTNKIIIMTDYIILYIFIFYLIPIYRKTCEYAFLLKEVIMTLKHYII